jgi:hypothetical protein
MLETQINPGTVVAGFGGLLFLALVFLLKWQYRRHIKPKVRVQRGLREYVSGNQEEAA